MLILISDGLDALFPQKLAALGEVTEDKGRLAEADVAVIRSKTKCTADWIDQAPNMKLIVRGGVGLDNVDIPYAQSKGILVSNTPTASSIAVAEQAFGFMLAAASLIVPAHQSMMAGKWEKKTLKRTELYGKKLALLGMGNIAVEVAKRAAAFGMTVVAYRQSGKPSPYADVKATLAEAVQDADYISMHLPLTAETRHLINPETLAGFKPGAVLVNTGRGDTVDADAVKAALQRGHLSLYATDVWPSDPPPADYPLLDAPNVLLAPHIGANTKENLARVGEEIISIIKTYQEKGTL